MARPQNEWNTQLYVFYIEIEQNRISNTHLIVRREYDRTYFHIIE